MGKVKQREDEEGRAEGRNKGKKKRQEDRERGEGGREGRGGEKEGGRCWLPRESGTGCQHWDVDKSFSFYISLFSLKIFTISMYYFFD